MTAFSLAFKVVDQTAGLNLNYRTCCWVQYCSEGCRTLLDWVSANCGEYPEMKIVVLYRIASNSGTLANGLAKVQAAREYDRATIYAITSEWKEKFLNPSMAHNTLEATEIVCRLDHTGRIADKQESATASLRDEIQMQDFAKPVASRVSR